MLVPQSEYLYFFMVQYLPEHSFFSFLNDMNFKGKDRVVARSGFLGDDAKASSTSFDICNWRQNWDMKNRKEKKLYFHLECTNTHRHGAMLAVALCVYVWSGVVTQCHVAEKLKFQSNISKRFFLLLTVLLLFSFCRFQRLVTMAATNRLSRSSASRSRRRRSRDHLNVYSSHTGRWM